MQVDPTSPRPPGAPCLVEGCPTPRQTTVTMRVDGTFRTLDVCLRHASAYAALMEERVVPA